MTIIQYLITILGIVTQFLFGLPTDLTLVSPVVFLPYATTTAQVVGIIDGDTIDVSLSGSDDIVRVRYIGIDTSELHSTGKPECWSKEATERNRALVAGQTVTMVPGADPYDTYDRLLAYVYTDTVFVNDQLVRDGDADILMIPPNTEYSQQFRIIRDRARSERIGRWTCPK